MSINAIDGALHRPQTNHYRFTWRTVLVATQAAGSRLLEIRNPGPTSLALVRLQIKWQQTAAHTAAIEDSLDVFTATAFTVDATTNTASPTILVKRTGMVATPKTVVKALAAAGAAAGMTGGTITPAAGPFAQLPQWLLLAQPTGGPIPPAMLDDGGQMDAGGNHAFIAEAGEGFAIQNRALLGAAAGSSVYFDVEFAEFQR